MNIFHKLSENPLPGILPTSHSFPRAPRTAVHPERSSRAHRSRVRRSRDFPGSRASSITSPRGSSFSPPDSVSAPRTKSPRVVAHADVPPRRAGRASSASPSRSSSPPGAVARADAWAHNPECAAMLAGAGPGTKLQASAAELHSARAVPVERGAVKTMLEVLLLALLSFASLASVSASWTEVIPTESPQDWQDITSSSDGTKLAVTASWGGNIWTSTDFGEAWTSRATTDLERHHVVE